MVLILRGRLVASGSIESLRAAAEARGGHAVVVVETDLASTAAIERVEGVRGIESSYAGAEPWRTLEVAVDPRCYGREAIHAAIVSAGARVRELHRREPSLESVFMELAGGAAR